ncbi:hypothetical protein D3C80_1073250 [compost metagenome]
MKETVAEASDWLPAISTDFTLAVNCVLSVNPVMVPLVVSTDTSCGFVPSEYSIK